MLHHEFFHEEAHLEENHEIKRILFLFAIILFVFFIYRFFCHKQEYTADRIAATKCGKNAAIENLKLLQITEGRVSFLKNIFSLHPRTEKRINYIIESL